MPSHRDTFATVALVGLTSLAYELVQVRMLAFFLGNNMDFLAIPLALLGLAIGSAYCHFVHRGPADGLVRWGRIAIFPLLIVVFTLFFALANLAFPVNHVTLADPRVDAPRMLAYGAILLPPYAVFGAMLSALFGRHADQIGRVYFYDLAGAALGCLLAPLLLAWFDLWAALLGVLAGGLGLLLIEWRGRPIPSAGAVFAFGVLGVLAQQEHVFHERPDPPSLARGIADPAHSRVREVAVRWNPIARTSLMRVRRADAPKEGASYVVVQDNGLSNVSLPPYREDVDPAELLTRVRHHALPWLLDVDPERVLVLFAGAGRDMLLFHQLTAGRADITGVELNGAVLDLADHPAVRALRLAELHALPNIHLVNEEGRDFLNHAVGPYDVVHVANNGAVHANRTGHTRKFLDTYEAMARYLDLLAPDGVLVFQNQPIGEKIPLFLRLLDERGVAEPERALLAFGRADRPNVDSLVVRPAGFTDAHVDRVRERVERDFGREQTLLYTAGRGRGAARLDDIVAHPERTRFVTDDQPFVLGLGLGELQVWPSDAQLRDARFVSSWIKVFTVLTFALASLVVAAGARLLGGPSARVPAPWLGFLLASGVGYMCIEIGLIAKTELFVGNPLYAVALNLGAFLIANAVGAWLQDRLGWMRSPARLVLAMAASVAWGLAAVAFCNTKLLSVPLAIKALGVVAATFPVGAVLGAFYPYCVSRLVESGRSQAVPFTYALTTLSSVLGSSFAMTAIIEFGFGRVVVLGAMSYVLAVICALFASHGEFPPSRDAGEASV